MITEYRTVAMLSDFKTSKSSNIDSGHMAYNIPKLINRSPDNN
jgi:hypothetical protein